MSFLRSLLVFFLSLIFTSAIFIAITSYAFGSLIQKDSMKGFLGSEGDKFIGIQCGDECSQYTDNQTECLRACSDYLTNRTSLVVDKAVDEVYNINFLGASLSSASSEASKYVEFFIISIISGIALLIASKSHFSTLGKNLITTAVALFILVVVVRTVIVYVNLPLNLGSDFISYLSPGLDKAAIYGLVLLVLGLVFVAINSILKRSKVPDRKK
jgi:hypothetical protein